jgi:gluconolactonase
LTEPEIVAEGLFFPEGLQWSAEDGTLVVTSVQEGAVYRVWVDEQRKERLADVGGGANNCALAVDGGVVVMQNGGLDAHAALKRRYPDLPDWPPVRRAKPGIQLVGADGGVRYVLDTGVHCPNDVVIASDETMYFTDPGNPFLAERPPRRVMRWSSDGELSVFAEGFDYCNGLEVTDDGAVLVTDHGGIIRLDQDGSRSWMTQELDGGGTDGIALDREGRVYLATQGGGGVRVYEGGKPVEFLVAPGGGSTTNCCFGGPEYRWLFAADALNGRILRWREMPTAGRAPHRWRPRIDVTIDEEEQ